MYLYFVSWILAGFLKNHLMLSILPNKKLDFGLYLYKRFDFVQAVYRLLLWLQDQTNTFWCNNDSPHENNFNYFNFKMKTNERFKEQRNNGCWMRHLWGNSRRVTAKSCRWVTKVTLCMLLKKRSFFKLIRNRKFKQLKLETNCLLWIGNLNNEMLQKITILLAYLRRLNEEKKRCECVREYC